MLYTFICSVILILTLNKLEPRQKLKKLKRKTTQKDKMKC